MRGAIPLSIAFHVGVASALVYGWSPSNDDFVYIPAVPIEVLTEAELAELISVPATVKLDEPVVEEDPVVPDVVEEIIPATPDPIVPPVVEDVPEDIPPPPMDPVVDVPSKPEEKKPDPVKPTPPVDDLDFSELSESLSNIDPDKASRRTPKVVNSDANVGERNQVQIGDGRRLSLTEEAMFQTWVEKCWDWDLGAPDSDNLVVSIRLTLSIDGELAEPVVVINDGEINRSGNRYWDAARRKATIAVQSCSPYSFLDPASYDNWRVVALNFKPPF